MAKEESPYEKFRNHPEAILNRIFCDHSGHLLDRWKDANGAMTEEAKRMIEAEKADMPAKISRWKDEQKMRERNAA